MRKRKSKELKDVVWGCGHAAHLMDEINSINGAAHIHIHFLTPDDEADGRLEFCCHGCGASVTVRYWADTERPSKRFLNTRTDFIQAHKKCKNRGYDQYCPNWRSSFVNLDLRSKRRIRLRLGPPHQADIPLLQPAVAAQSTNAGLPKEDPHH